MILSTVAAPSFDPAAIVLGTGRADARAASPGASSSMSA
jgi:hypothetical protein